VLERILPRRVEEKEEKDEDEDDGADERRSTNGRGAAQANTDAGVLGRSEDSASEPAPTGRHSGRVLRIPSHPID